MKIKKHTLNNILLILLLILILTFIYFTYGTYKLFSLEQKKMHVFYITDAGINQAIWYLSTPKHLGGFGPSWRTDGLEKFYSVGKYIVSVKDGIIPGEIIITSTGEAYNLKQMAQVTVTAGRNLPKAFSFVLFSDEKLEIDGETSINGSIFCNDDISIRDKTKILNGKVFVPVGCNIDHSSNYPCEKGFLKYPLPNFPVLDTSFYYEKITSIKMAPKNLLKGNIVLKNYNLNGKTIYIDGNAKIDGNLKGPGIIVSTRNIEISGDGKIEGSVMIISNGSLTFSGRHKVLESALFYSRQKLKISSDSLVNGICTFISPTVLEIGKNCNITGLFYALEINLDENIYLKGSIVCNNFYKGKIKDVNITFDEKHMPYTVIGFNVDSDIIIMKKPGTWREIKT